MAGSVCACNPIHLAAHSRRDGDQVLAQAAREDVVGRLKVLDNERKVRTLTGGDRVRAIGAPDAPSDN